MDEILSRNFLFIPNWNKSIYNQRHNKIKLNLKL
jgi:hypothetical protein